MDEFGGIAVDEFGGTEVDEFGGVPVEAQAAPAGPSHAYASVGAGGYSPGREAAGLGLYEERVPTELQVKPVPNTGLAPLLQPLIPLREAFSLGSQFESAVSPKNFGGGVVSEGVPELQPLAGAVKGAENVVGGGLEFLTSPVGFATLGLGAAPAGVRALASTAFAADMTSHAPEAWEKYWTAAYAGDRMGQAEALTEGLGTLALAGLAGSHGYAQARTALAPRAELLARALDESTRGRSETPDVEAEAIAGGERQERPLQPPPEPATVPPAVAGAETITGPKVATAAAEPPETAATSDERTGSAMPAEREERLTPPPPSPSLAPTGGEGRGEGVRRPTPTPERPPDIIDAIDGMVGGKIDPDLIREADPNWRPVGAARKLFRRGGRGADQVLNALTYEGPQLGLTRETPLGEFGEALNAAARARQDYRRRSSGAAQTRAQQAERRQAGQDAQFTAKVLQGERPRGQQADVERVEVGGLVEGDTFEVQGQRFTVERIGFDEDGYTTSVTVKDGPKFGIHKIGPDEFIHIDKASLKLARTGTGEPQAGTGGSQARTGGSQTGTEGPQAGTEGAGTGTGGPQAGTGGAQAGTGGAQAGTEGGLIANTGLETWADSILKQGRVGSFGPLDPQLMAALVVKGAALLERGVRRFADWSAQMVRDHGPEIRPHLRRIWEEARAAWQGEQQQPLGLGLDEGAARPGRVLRAVQQAQAATEAGAQLASTPAGAAPATRSALSGVYHLAGEAANVVRGLAGQSMPRTTRLDRRAGELGVRYASSPLAAPFAAKAFADEVLTGLDVDPIEFGAALTEDNLRSVKAGFVAEGDLASANKVHTLIGAEGSPFQTEAELGAFLNQPGTQAALERHRQAWDKTVDPMYRNAMLIDDLLPLPSRGLQTEARINLFALRGGEETRPRAVVGARPPNLTATFRRKSPFGRRATGASEEYAVDYREIMENTFRRQLEIANKNAFDGHLVQSGLAYIGPPGEALPLAGEPTVPFPLKRTVLVTRTEGGQTRTVPAAANLYVRKSIAREYELAANLYRNRFTENAGRLTKGFNSAALAGLTDATVHVSNLATVLFTRPLNAARNPAADILLSAFGRADVPIALLRAIGKGLSNHSAQLGRLAEIGVLRGEYHTGINPLGKLIAWADRTTRLVMDDTFQAMVERGLVENTETARREWINQAGQYNKRLQPTLTHALRETGIGPFITAGKAFNVLGVRNLFHLPGVKATSPAGASMLRAAIAARWLGAAVLIGALNYLLTKDKGGGMTGRPGTPLGRIDTGRDSEAGRPLTIPALDLLGLGRGLRVTGVRGAVEAKRLGLDTQAAFDASMRDLVNAWSGPALGPTVRAATEAATGYAPAVGMPRHAPVVPPGDSQFASDLANALYESNPLVATYRESGAMQRLTPWMPYADQLPPKPTSEVIARQVPRFTLLPGKPAEMIERYPEIVQRAKANSFLDDVIHRARTMGLEKRIEYLQTSVTKLPLEEQKHAWDEIKRRRVLVLPAAATK